MQLIKEKILEISSTTMGRLNIVEGIFSDLSKVDLKYVLVLSGKLKDLGAKDKEMVSVLASIIGNCPKFISIENCMLKLQKNRFKKTKYFVNKFGIDNTPYIINLLKIL